MAPFIPPCTGTSGVASSVTANLFDATGNFRPRSRSKRSRTEAWGAAGDSLEERFDLTRTYQPLVYPRPPALDIDAIRACMIEAAKSATETKALLADKKGKAADKLLAGSLMAFWKLLETVVEKAIIPFAESAKNPPLPSMLNPSLLSPRKHRISGRRWRGRTGCPFSSVPTWDR